MTDNQQELFPLVNEEGRVVGKATRGECHSGSKTHKAISTCNGDPSGRTYNLASGTRLWVDTLTMVRPLKMPYVVRFVRNWA